jgi:replicative DNA helicase
MNETLQDYGYNFQVKVLSSLMTDRNFVNHIYDILLPSYFDSKALRWICEHTLLYFKEYKKLPSLEVFKVQVNSVKIDLDKKEIVHSLKDVWKQIESDDLQFVKETILEFSKNQELKRAILKSVDLLNSGKFDEIKREIDNALKKGMNESLGHDYLTEVEQRYVENAQGLRISTGWDVIDNITGGGIPAGKLCVWIAGPGGSKSFHLVHLGGTALKLGKTVLHYTLELDENYVAQRYDAFFTGIELDDLKFHVKEIDKRLEKYRKEGKLTIKFFPTKGISLQGLKAHIEKTIMLDKKPDIIILDYADLLKLGTNQNMRKDELLQELYEELRGLAGELNIPIHTASQINRSGVDTDVIEGDSISESFGKMFTADFVASISRRSKDKVNKTARVHIVKNRLGPDGMTFPEYIDTAKSEIRIYDERTDEGQKTKSEMRSDEAYEKQQLSIIYNKNQQTKNLI